MPEETSRGKRRLLSLGARSGAALVASRAGLDLRMALGDLVAGRRN